MTNKVMLLLIIVCLFSINTNIFSAAVDNQTILTVGDEKITFGEVKKVYDKNVMRTGIYFDSLSRDSVRKFLETYSIFKMKVAYGIEAGYDSFPEIVEDVEHNRRILAESYLIDSQIIEPALQRYMNMRKTQRQIAIIMSDFPPSGDTLDAYNKIMSALKEINNGESFEFAAKKFSSDTSTGNHGGVVPVWVTGLKLQRNLENIIYGLKIGELTQKPIKTEFGYFLIKLLKEEPRIFIGISHILIPYKNDNRDLGPIVKDSVEGRKLADSIYQELSKVGNFNSFAERLSADKTTSVKGGTLGIYARSTGIVGSGENIDPYLENAAFALKDKQFSTPIETHLGIHIIKRDSTVLYPDNFEYEEMKANYNRLFLSIDKERYYDSLGTIYGFNMNTSVLDKIIFSVDTTKMVFDSSFRSSISVDLLSQTLFSINNKSYSVQNYLDSISSIKHNKMILANRQGLIDLIMSIKRSLVIENAIKNIDKTHPQFDMIMKEYASGIILFKVDQENVWNKVKFDSLKARKFYDTTKMDLSKPLQYDLSEIYIMSKKKADEVYNDIKTGKISFDSAVILYSQRQGAREKKGVYGVVNTSNYLAYQAEKNKYKVDDISEPLSFEQGFSIIKINNIYPAGKMTFEESLPLISSSVQLEYTAELQANWIKELFKKYPVKYNDKLINKVFKK